jgi:1,4-alpha-glucan branching enzyme
MLLVALNYTPVPRHNYRVGVPVGGVWKELLNTDSTTYWGSGQGNLGEIEASPLPFGKWLRSLTLTLPPLAGVILKPTSPQPMPKHPRRN